MRLRRGLNVVIGDVGTGKTTLCRQLIRSFTDDENYETHLILDPQFSSPSEFLGAIVAMFEEALPAEVCDEWKAKELIKNYLFRRGVDEKKTVVLIIDEGQKLPLFCLELLREFLNYETNEFKLLQIAIFAQKEFEKTLREHANFADRINLYHELGPMSFRDTRQMIQFRLNQASRSAKAPDFFSYMALWAIFRSTGGYPRKIINLCHRCLLTMIIQNRNKAGWLLVRSSVQRAFSMPAKTSLQWSRIFAVVLIGVGLIALAGVLMPERIELLLNPAPKAFQTAKVQTVLPPSNTSPTRKPEVVAKKTEPVVQIARVPAAKPAVQPGPDELPDATHQPKIDTGTEPSTASVAVENRLPLALGRVALKRNETLWKLIEKVYNVNDSHIISSQYIEAVKAANPYIDDPDHIKAGRLISLPAVPAKVKPLHVKIWWVKLEEKNRLDEAVNVLRQYPAKAPPVKIIPYWNRRFGLRFAILLREYYFDETSAENQLHKLPPKLAPMGKILAEWDESTVFYADPFS